MKSNSPPGLLSPRKLLLIFALPLCLGLPACSTDDEVQATTTTTETIRRVAPAASATTTVQTY